MILAMSSTNGSVFLTDTDPNDPANTITWLMWEDATVWERIHYPTRTLDEVRKYHAGWDDEILHDGDFPCV